MTSEIKRLQRELEVTVLYVTHDQQEALRLSDHIGVLASGNIAQYDTPGVVHNKPRSRYIGRLVGQLNEHPLSQVSELACGVVGGCMGEALIRAPARDELDIKSINFVGVRPHFVSLSKAPPDPNLCNAIVGRIEEAVLIGSGVLYTVRLPSGQQWYSQVADYYPGIEIGSEAFVMWPAEHTVLLES
jgi:ABC-type Fe3+/spermidine/putrescine transport system ATPase subunit